MAARPQFRPPAPKYRPPQPKAQANRPRRHFAEHSRFPYLMAMLAKEGQKHQGTTSHATTTISRVIGPRSAPIPRRIAIKTRVIRNRPIQKHILDTCIIQSWKKSPWEKLSLPVCFLLTNIPPLFYLILELLIHL